MFWLVMLQGINLADCVRCLHCKDNITPGHEPDDCPLVALVASNAVAITAATGAAVSVAKLLPVKIMRLFPKTVLDAIKALHNRPSGTFDYEGKSMRAMSKTSMMAPT